MAQFGGLATGRSHVFTAVKLEDLEITCKDAAGNKLATWWYLATLPDGTEKKGQLDANGYAKLERVPRGEVNVKITQDEPRDATPAPAPPPEPPPEVTPPSPGEGTATEDRREPMDDRLEPFQPPQPEPADEAPPEPEPAPPAPAPAEPADTPPPAPRRKLVDIAIGAVDELEWEAMVLEMTEGRHGDKSGANCPQGGKCGKGCKGFFYSWCGDFASWVYWKAGCTDGTLLNRASLNGKWVCGKNLTYVQNWGKKNGMWRVRGSGFVPSPGDFHFTDHIPSWHIGIVEKVEGDTIWTLDGKSFDSTWWQKPEVSKKLATKTGRPQGVARTKRSISKCVAFVDTRELRAQLGYD